MDSSPEWLKLFLREQRTKTTLPSMRPSAKPLDPWYVTGFVEGEGCFTYSRSGPRLALYFAIKLTGADAELLRAFQEFFRGIGRIYRVAPRTPRHRSGFTKAAAYYRVCRCDELVKVVSHFDAYPLHGAKTSSYRIWRQMVLLKKEFGGRRGQHLEPLAARLSAASPRNAPWSATPLELSDSER